MVQSLKFAKDSAQILEMRAQDKRAEKIYRLVAKRLSESDDSRVREAASQFEEFAKVFALVGQPMPVSGKVLEGGRFDIAQFKGKVVLVDFWATWCGPCRAELPNVKEVYDKYHKRGFEVVGISLDDDAGDLTSFIKEEHLAWPILFEGGDGATGFDHPMAKRYEVDGIPRAVLLNREGKVVTVSARGDKLGELVGELLGSTQGVKKAK